MIKSLPNLYRRFWNNRKKIQIALLAMVIFGGWFLFCLPDPLFTAPTSYVVEASNGDLLSAAIAADGQWRFPFNPQVPEKFRDCIITFEDKRFFSHPGIDPLAMARAIKQNLSAGGTVSGASTLSMQVIRLARGQKRNLWQKLLESLMALRLELGYSKTDILSLYASHAPFGSNVVGLDAAAWRYYGRDARQLSWGEMAALAVLPNAPALVHPGKNRNSLLYKRNLLLDKLVTEKIIDSSTAVLSKLEPLPDEPKPLPQLAPHLLQRFRKENPKNASTLLRSTLSKPIQQTVLRITEQHHRELMGNGVQNICALVLEVETGQALAYVGNAYHPENPSLQSHVDIITAPRSPGSTLKPLLYAAMLTDGILLPHGFVPDIPTQIGGYTPQNFDKDYDGVVPASQALARSLNVPAVRMLRTYTYPRFYENLQQLGFSTITQPADHYGLSLILGGCEVTAWDMAGTYAAIARKMIQSSTENKKEKSSVFFKASYQPQAKQRQNGNDFSFIDPIATWYMLQAMEEVMRPGEEGLWKQFSSAQRVAWKTGTSFGFRDAWAVGITPKHVVVVWAGNGSGEGRPGLTGVQAAAPVLFDIMKALPAAGWFAYPAAPSIRVAVCTQTGMRPNPDCPDIDSIVVSEKADRSPLCPYHSLLHLDAAGLNRVTEKCLSPAQMIHKSWLVLPPVMEWYYRRKHLAYVPPPAFRPGCESEDNHQTLGIIYPETNARIYIPLEVNGERGNVVFIAAHQRPEARLYWHVDNVFAGTTTRFHQLALQPPPGRHTLTIVDEKGETVSRRFEITDRAK